MDSGFSINGRYVGKNARPYIIAELSANHNGKLEDALRIVEAAKDAGVDAVKLQTYKPDTITLDSDADDFRIKEGLWKGQTLYQLYEHAHLPWEWHGPLFQHAKTLGITIFSSPFDFTAVDLLEELGCPAYKIASFELVDIPLIEYVAQTGKPMIMSTGMASQLDIMEAVVTARRAGCDDLCLLHCTSGYPTPPNESDLYTIQSLSDRYGLVTGLSDHTLEPAVPIAAVALGARVIEKHFTLRRSRGGPDAEFSLEPEEMSRLVHDCAVAWEALGSVRDKPRESEQAQSPMRRSLYITRDLQPGDVLSPENVRSVRPGYGLPTRHYREVLGCRVNKALPRGTALKWEFIDKP